MAAALLLVIRSDRPLCATSAAVLAEHVRALRIFGSTVLCLVWVACGRCGAYFEHDLSSWDVSAGALLVSIERKNPGAVGQHALGVAGPAEPLGAALRGQGREQCGARRSVSMLGRERTLKSAKPDCTHQITNFEFLQTFRTVLCLLCLCG